jgi:hypothetical protein
MSPFGMLGAPAPEYVGAYSDSVSEPKHKAPIRPERSLSLRLTGARAPALSIMVVKDGFALPTGLQNLFV